MILILSLLFSQPVFAGGPILKVIMNDGPRLNWLRGLDLNQRPSGYEPDARTLLQTPNDLIHIQSLTFLPQLLLLES